MDASEETVTLGSALRSIRKERGWSLADASKATGFSISTLSKVENDQRSLTYDKLVQLANALSVDVARLFTAQARTTGLALFAGRRSVHRIGDGFTVPAEVYTYNYLAHDLIHKRFTPVIMDVHARSVDQFEQLLKHSGDEFTYVLDGEIEVHTEIYAPLRLKAGESVFFDSGVGHAYVNVGEGAARILCIGSDVTGLADELMRPKVKRAAAPSDALKPGRRGRKPAAIDG